MASKLKCPFCGKELQQGTPDTYSCPNIYCPQAFSCWGSIPLWQALIQAKQDLEQSEKCCSAWETQALDYKAETIALSGKLEIAVDALKRLEKELYFNNAKQTGHIADSVMSIPSIALEQIEALEQKE